MPRTECVELSIPARNIKRLPGDPRRFGRSEEDGSGRDVFWLTDPAQRGLRFDLLAEIAFTRGDALRRRAFRLDHSRIDRVDADPAAPVPWPATASPRRPRPWLHYRPQYPPELKC